MCPRMVLNHHWGKSNSWARAFTTFSTSAQPPELSTARKTESIGPRVRIQMTAEPRSLVIMFHLLIDFFHSFFSTYSKLPPSQRWHNEKESAERRERKRKKETLSFRAHSKRGQHAKFSRRAGGSLLFKCAENCSIQGREKTRRKGPRNATSNSLAKKSIWFHFMSK